jgi:hypothetical protein
MSGKSAPSPTRRRRRGRPTTQLGEQERGKLLTALRRGLPLSDAAWLGGISPRTAQRWRLDGEKDDANGRDTPERAFWRDTSTAIAEGRALLASWAFSLARYDGHLAVKLLERRDPTHWGPKQELAVTTPTAPVSPRSKLLARLDAIEDRMKLAQRQGIGHDVAPENPGATGPAERKSKSRVNPPKKS